ncbi:MAG: iron-sulfur cluster assembly protein [Candidatus Shikimatogenerans bostrichidophilus]|nr:MAG: iron-sulfur cluster assembly protein [Candidatus Shikimatogenerans bostrichidophilus]
MKKKKKLSKKNIIKILKNIYDPELNINIYDMGLIYKINIKKKKLFILMTFTSPNCPLYNEILKNIEKKIKKKIKNINDINIEITFEPSWNKNMMSDVAKLELGII